MTYAEVLKNARENIGQYCKACPVCNGLACKNQIPGPGAKGVGDTAIQINESWSEDGLDTTCNTTFHLSQPVRKMTRKIEETFALVYAMGMEESENGAVAYFVPAGTVLTMEQIFQSGKSRAKNYTSFRAEDLSGEEIWSGESLTVEAGKIYKLDYASSDSVEVYFIAV